MRARRFAGATGIRGVRLAPLVWPRSSTSCAAPTARSTAAGRRTRSGACASTRPARRAATRARGGRWSASTRASSRRARRRCARRSASSASRRRAKRRLALLRQASPPAPLTSLGRAEVRDQPRLQPGRRSAHRAGRPVARHRRGTASRRCSGVTGSGKTATMAFTIEQVQRPALVIAHNKTLAAQLCNEFREFFPKNSVEYFVSYYDYYQPEAYVPAQDLYIEKDSSINEEIDRLRHSATSALFARRDVIVVASVSCIYGLGSPQKYNAQVTLLKKGEMVGPRRDPAQARRQHVHAQRPGARPRHLPRARRDARGLPGLRRVRVPRGLLRRRDRGDPALRPAHRRGLRRSSSTPASGRPPTTPPTARRSSARWARSATRWRRAAPSSRQQGKLLESHRLRQRTQFDMEMLRELGFCNGIENYSRILDGRAPGERPFCLLDFFPDDFVCFIDESHQTVPQIGGMFEGDRSRKNDARRLRLPPAERARQPAADVRRVPPAHAADRLRVRHAGRLRAQPLLADRRADRAADGRDRPGGRRPRDEEPDRRPDGGDPPARRGRGAHARDHADQEDGRGPHRLPARVRLPGALPALRDRHARADPDHPRAAARRVRRPGGREPPARGPRPARRSRWWRSSTRTRRASSAARPR